MRYNFRLPADIDQLLRDRLQAEGRTPTEFFREAALNYVARTVGACTVCGRPLTGGPVIRHKDSNLDTLGCLNVYLTDLAQAATVLYYGESVMDRLGIGLSVRWEDIWGDKTDRAKFAMAPGTNMIAHFVPINPVREVRCASTNTLLTRMAAKVDGHLYSPDIMIPAPGQQPGLRVGIAEAINRFHLELAQYRAELPDGPLFWMEFNPDHWDVK